MLVLKRVEVRYRLVTDEANRATAERVHGVHADHCPVARSIRGAIEVETHLEIVSPADG